jgi:hypothetical protein
VSKGKANYINKRLVDDWVSLQNWLGSRRLDGETEFNERRHEMDSHELAEHSGYYRAIRDVINILSIKMNEWPDLDAHRPYKNSSSTMT